MVTRMKILIIEDEVKLAEAIKRGLEQETFAIDIEYDSLLENANHLIEKMPTQQKKIFLLSINSQLTNEQIAQQMSISKKTVDNYLSMAKNSLRKSLAAELILFILFL